MSNLLEKASIILTPTAYNDGKVLCVKPTDGSGDFDFSRNSAATRVNAQGLVENVQTISGNLLDYSTFTSPSASWSLVGGLWVFDDTANGYILTPNIAVVVGDVFDVVVDVTIASGNANFRYASGNAQTSLFPFKDFVDGVNEFQATVTGVDGFLQRIFAPASLTDNPFTLNSISIKKISQDTNLPRINYEGGCGSWLFEPQSTNHCDFSEQPSVWHSSSNVTITANAETSPQGISNASTVVNTTTNAYVRNLFNFSSSAATLDVTTSFFIKYTNNQWVYLRPNFFTGGSNSRTWFDIQNGVLGTNDNVSSSIKDFGNGWYRCSVTHQIAPATDTTGYVHIYACDNDNSTTQVIGQGFAAFGSQGEEFSYSTSYIPTSGSTVTRNQDLCTNGGSLATINSTEGVLYAEIAALADDGTNRVISVSDGTTANRVSIVLGTSSNQIRGQVLSSGTSFDFSTTSYNTLNNNKIAISYKLNDFSMWINGTKVSTDTSGNTPVGMNTISFNAGGSTLFFFGKTKALAVWKEALSDAELTSLTTI